MSGKAHKPGIRFRLACLVICAALSRTGWSMGLRSFVALPVEKGGKVLRLQLERTPDAHRETATVSMAWGLSGTQTLLFGVPYRPPRAATLGGVTSQRSIATSSGRSTGLVARAGWRCSAARWSRLTQRKLLEIEHNLEDLTVLRNELQLLVNLCRAAEDGCPILEKIEER